MTNEQLERIEYLRTKSEETELTPIEKREFSELALKSAEEALEQAKEALEESKKSARHSFRWGIVGAVMVSLTLLSTILLLLLVI